MKRKICTLFALFCCFGVFSTVAAGCSKEQNGDGNEYVVNNETNISGGNLSADPETEESYRQNYAVIFITNADDIHVPAQTVESGGKAVEPEISRLGYTLLGWYTADGEKWDFENSAVTDHMMLTAWWQENQ